MGERKSGEQEDGEGGRGQAVVALSPSAIRQKERGGEETEEEGRGGVTDDDHSCLQAEGLGEEEEEEEEVGLSSAASHEGSGESKQGHHVPASLSLEQ